MKGRLVLFSVVLGCAQTSSEVGRVTLETGRDGQVGGSFPSDVDCGQLEGFDSDGDGISDPVEDNNGRNRYADLVTGRCDPDPSRPIGRPHDGQLQGGLNLPDVGTGYKHYRGSDAVDTDDWGTLALLTCIESAARALAPRGISLDVGNLSRRGGGDFSPHSSHQNGLDADFRYIRKDRQSAPLDLRFQPDEYDADATQVLIETLFAVCNINMIFADVDRLGFDVNDWPVLHAEGHTNHLHVRVVGDTP